MIPPTDVSHRPEELAFEVQSRFGARVSVDETAAVYGQVGASSIVQLSHQSQSDCVAAA